MPKLSKKLDWEVEIAFVVGKDTKYISEKDAPNHILGYCMVNDISERDGRLREVVCGIKENQEIHLDQQDLT